MKLPLIVPTRNDVSHLEELASAVNRCATARNEEIGAIYWAIGRLLLENVHRLNIDEDVQQLLFFARSMSCEMLTPEVRAKNFGASCWSVDRRENCPPYVQKIEGRNRPTSAIQDQNRQMVEMVHLFAMHLLRDPARVASGQALLSYEFENGPWSEDDLEVRE
jgi:hypothetical protein